MKGKPMHYEQFKKLVLDGEVEPPGKDATPGVESSDDDALYREYLAMLSGDAARRRSIEDAREEQRQTEREWRSWAEHVGSPLPRNLEG